MIKEQRMLTITITLLMTTQVESLVSQVLGQYVEHRDVREQLFPNGLEVLAVIMPKISACW